MGCFSSKSNNSDPSSAKPTNINAEQAAAGTKATSNTKANPTDVASNITVDKVKSSQNDPSSKSSQASSNTVSGSNDGKDKTSENGAGSSMNAVEKPANESALESQGNIDENPSLNCGDSCATLETAITEYSDDDEIDETDGAVTTKTSQNENSSNKKGELSEDKKRLVALPVDICSEPSCKKPATKACARCLSVAYCSRECQIKHWKAENGHKLVCRHHSGIVEN